MATATRLICAAILACVTYLLAGCDADSAEVTAKIVAEVDEKKAYSPEGIFSHPIQWDATVTQNGKTRFYVRSER